MIPTTFDLKDDNAAVPLWQMAATDLSSTTDKREQWLKGSIHNQSDLMLGCPPFLLSAALRRREIMEFILSTQASTVDMEISLEPSGDRALHICVANGEDEMLRSLLKYGAKPEARNNLDETPIHLAAASGNDSTARILLGPSMHVLNLVNNKGRIAVCVAALNGHGNVVRSLLETAGVQADLQDKKGRTPLS
jgi:ankyrin repeat protein